MQQRGAVVVGLLTQGSKVMTMLRAVSKAVFGVSIIALSKACLNIFGWENSIGLDTQMLKVCIWGVMNVWIFDTSLSGLRIRKTPPFGKTPY